jgi:hypothetical protein
MTTLGQRMDSSAGLGNVVAGTNAQGYNVALREYPLGWRTNLYWTGMAHSVIQGSASEPRGGAVQGSAIAP